MKVSSFFKTASLLSSLLTAPVLGQVGAPYTHPKTGIKFWKTTITGTVGGYEWGWALPGAPTGANDEYIGLLVGSRVAGAGWSGLSHGYGMPSALLLVAWVDGTSVRTDFRYAPGYVTPDPYTGVANLTKISETVNSTHFELLYRCQGCWAWNQGGEVGGQPPTGEVTVVGWAQDNRNPVPLNRNDAAILQHNNGYGQFGNPPQSARNAAYTDWVKLAQPPVTTTSATATATATAAPCTATAPATTFDYIVIGSGAGGIPVADKLSESGKSVLLIEKGPPSSGRWGGSNKVFPNWQPKWLEGTNLTRFDVPGLCNQLWVDSANIACDGISEMAGCVLGGGTAVNAALWWKPNPSDWDTVFPNGWKSSDMKSPTERVFKRIPGTDHPSKDGKLYLQQGYDVISSALAASGWKNVVANNVPEQKNQVYAHTPYMFANAERDGPMATYLVSASKRSNFKLWTNTQVKRVIRSGGHVTGVEVEAFGKGGYCGTVKVTPNTGRVVLSAGVFGTSKILMRSGIGPQDQLAVVNASKDAGSMIKEADWIKLPVGYNLVDHVNTDVVVHHPNVTFYDFYKAWTDPIAADIDAYLKKRTGILTQAAPNIGPLFWEQIKGSDGITRQLQWTARVEQSLDVNDTTAMTLSQYLGTGSTSRGRLTIGAALNVGVSTVPYLQSQGDIDAVVQGVANIQKILGKIPTIVFDQPAPGQSAKDYVAAYRVATANRRSNHWAGTAKMGTDSGEFSAGTSVVDLNTRVYGTDNLYVVDASLFPGIISTNPSSYIVTVAERAAERIIASPALSPVAKYGQCGGRSHTGARFCASSTTCQFQNPDYSQCL